MDRKTLGIITVIASVFLCGLPGLAGLCLGSMSFLGSFLPNSGVPTEGKTLIVGASIMILGLSLVFITIPIGAGIWTWWSQKNEAASMEQLILPEDDF